jgi:PAS domain S-box-containing protein
MLDDMPNGIFVTTRAGLVHYANAAIRRMLLIPGEAALADISPATGRTFDPADRERFWNILETDGVVSGFEIKFTRYDGQQIDVVINARLRPGEPPVCEGSVADITARKTAERALDSLNRMLMEATREAGIAEAAGEVLHKVGNVLTSVNLTIHDMRDLASESCVANLCLLADCLVRERDRLHEFLTADPAGRQLPDLLLRISRRLAGENERLTSDLMSLDRHCIRIRECIINRPMVAGDVERLELLEIEPLVAIVIRLESETCRRAGIEVESRIEPGLSSVVDRLKLVQILLCLVCHFSETVARNPEGQRRIALAVHRDGPWIRFSVSSDAATVPAPDGRGEQTLAPDDGAHDHGLHRSIIAARAAGGTLAVLPAGGFLFRLPYLPARTP